MRKGSDLIGKPIVAFDSGEQFERVHDLLFDQQSNQLLGFLVDEGGWFSAARVLPLTSVQVIGQDAIIVPTKSAVVNAAQVPAINRVLERNNVLKGTKIMTTDGRDLGTMADLYFDEATGNVEGYEVSGGLFADAYTGRSFVPAPQTLKIGEDVAFVPPETAELMAEQVGGLKGAAQSAADQIQEGAQRAGTGLTNAAVDPAEQKAFVVGRTASGSVEAPDGTLLVGPDQVITPLAADEAERQGVLDQLFRAAGGSISGALGARAGSAIAGSSLDAALGRRVQHAVRTDQGLIIAAPSQIVTESVISRARTYHREAELLDAVGLSTGDAARSQATSTTDAARAQLQTGAHQVSAGAGNLWDRVKEKVAGFQERTEEEAEAGRINDALGRPVSRVILDKQDAVILNVGELITHQAIADARAAGALDILLGSVYDKDPEITKDELRAPEPGEASLEQRERNAS